MRVLLDVSAVPAQPRGAGVYVQQLARALAGPTPPPSAPEIVLLTRKGDTDRWQTWAPGAEVHAAVPRARPARLAWEQAEGPRWAAQLGVDVWHGPHYTLPLRLRIPSVVTVHDLTLLEHPEWHEWVKVAYFRRMIPAAVARAEVCICVSRHTAERLGAVGAVAREVVVIHHGVDRARFTPDGDASADLAQLARFGVTTPYVAFLGTIEPRKSVAMLVDAFASVASAHDGLRLVLAGGTGWGSDDVGAMIAAREIVDRVVRTGYLPDDAVPALFRRADVVAYPSFEEGFGIPALEALACGAPLVTTKGSSVEEVVGDAALLVEPGSVGALADGLEAALDAATASALRGRGPSRAESFSWRASADAHVAAYERAFALRS
jgi:glycosyltransferase involved in cell wall biosynthesis